MAKDDRLRLSVKPDYTTALGIAVFAFARAEWDAIWCCEKMLPGCIAALRERTAGGIANELSRLAQTLPPSAEATELRNAAEQFKKAVGLRNGLLHAIPANIDGENVLSTGGGAWTAEKIGDAADQFSCCQVRLNASLHGFLMLQRSGN